MNPKLRALIWEQCRTGGSIALVCVGCGALVMAVSRLSPGHSSWHYVGGTVLAAAMLPTLTAALLQVLDPNSAGQLVGGFPTRILRLPVKTSQAIAIALIARTTFTLLTGLTLTALSHALFHNGPTLSDIIFLTQLYLIIQLLDWLRGPLSGLTSLTALVLAATLLFMLRYSEDLLKGYENLSATTAATPLTLTLLLAATYLIALPTVRATQRGERIGIPELWEWPKHLTLPGAQRAIPFPTPLSAQTWSELRHTAWRLPALTAFICLLYFAVTWGTGRFGTGFPWDIIPLVSIVPASLIHGLIRPSPSVAWRQKVQAVPYLYPIRTLDMLKARLLADGLSLTATLTIAGTISTLLFLSSGQGFPLTVISESLAAGETTLRELLAYLLAPVLLTGTLAWIAMAPTTRLMLLLAVTSGALGICFLLGRSYFYEPLLPYGPWPFIFLIAIALFTGYGAAWRLGLMPRRHLIKWGAAWLLLTLVLFPTSHYDNPVEPDPDIGPYFSTITALFITLAFSGLAMLPAVAITLDLNRRRHGQDTPEDPAQHHRPAQNKSPSTPILKTALLTATACAIVLVTWLRWPAEPAYRTAFRAQGLPATLQELDQWYPHVPDEQNLALEYLSIYENHAQNASDFWEALEDEQGDSITDPGTAYWHQDYFNLLPVTGGAVLTRAEPIPAEIWDFTLDYWNAAVSEAAGRMEALDPSKYLGSRYPIDLTEGYFVGVEHMAKLRELGRTNTLDAVKASAENDPARALDAFLATLTLANSLDPEPLVVSRLVQFAILGIAVASLKDTMNRVDLTEEDLIRLQRQLEAALPPPEERFVMDRAMLGDLVLSLGALWPKSPGVSGVLFTDHIWYFDRLVYIRTTHRGIEANRRLGAPSHNLSQALTHALEKGLPYSRILMSSITFPEELEVYQGEWRARLQLDLARTAAALERYRIAHGRLPATLDQLIPTYLPHIPTDPFAPPNTPIQYHLDPTGEYTLTSPGEGEEEEEARKAMGQFSTKRATNYRRTITFTVAPPHIRALARTVEPSP